MWRILEENNTWKYGTSFSPYVYNMLLALKEYDYILFKFKKKKKNKKIWSYFSIILFHVNLCPDIKPIWFDAKVRL